MSTYKTDTFKEKMRLVSTGDKNPMYGKTVYEQWVEKYGEEKAKELDRARRHKNSVASSGSNNQMFGKPAPQGSGNGWSGWYKDWYFRSLHELTFIINTLELSGKNWTTGEKACVKISYVNWNGSQRTYIPDFLIEDKELIEIKPVKLWETPLVIAKKTAAELYCIEKGLQFSLIDPGLLEAEAIKVLRNEGKIRFLDRYEKKFSERYDGK